MGQTVPKLIYQLGADSLSDFKCDDGSQEFLIFFPLQGLLLQPPTQENTSCGSDVLGEKSNDFLSCKRKLLSLTGLSAPSVRKWNNSLL